MAYSEETRQQVVDLYRSGYSRLEIQVETGISQPTIRKILAENGYPPREIRDPVRLTAEVCERIIEMRNAGASVAQIEDQTGVSKRSIWHVIKQYVDHIHPHRRGTISAEQFIAVWQKAASVDDVARELGISVESASHRAGTFRQKGIPLKKMPTAQPYYWDDLAEFATLMLENDEEGGPRQQASSEGDNLGLTAAADQFDI